jgi:hypothetical protein
MIEVHYINKINKDEFVGINFTKINESYSIFVVLYNWRP